MGFVIYNPTPLPLWISSLFAEPSKEEIADYAAFGRFIAAFALAEGGVHIAARQFSGLTDDNARVIFGGMRLTNLAEKLRKLTAETDNFKEVDELLTQLDVISQERDKLVHRLIEYDPKDGFKVTDRLTVKSLASAELQTFTPNELKAMELDCKAIFSRFVILSNQLEERRLAGYDLTLLELYVPWRYKHTQQLRKTKQRRANARSRRHQRRAFRASR